MRGNNANRKTRLVCNAFVHKINPGAADDDITNGMSGMDVISATTAGALKKMPILINVTIKIGNKNKRV